VAARSSQRSSTSWSFSDGLKSKIVISPEFIERLPHRNRAGSLTAKDQCGIPERPIQDQL
jgi:hypothetical protein